ncbi:UNVERIFIED_CONTAM: hypothetical protein RMT77_009678 [Armadillidium vulgare]
MTTAYQIFLTISVSFAYVYGLGIDVSDLEDEEDTDQRLLIGATGNVPFNASQLATIVGLLSAALLPLIALMCLCALAVGFALHSNSGGYEDGGYGSYSEAYSRALGFENFDWETVSIIDWISLGEETFRKFDPTNMECHKRVICELHQNAKEFGTLATRMVGIFGYLKYLSLFNLPDMVKSLADEIEDAADRGRSSKKDCGETFINCDFSVKAIYERYNKL